MVNRIARGFTLIEVMVVVVILAILAAIVIPKIMERPEQARIVKAREDVVAIENAMNLYRLDNGFYPSTAQGIKALVKKPSSTPAPENWAPGGYLQHIPVDPWGHAYHYLNPGEHGTIDIFSYGPTEVPSQHEIGNWNLNHSVA